MFTLYKEISYCVFLYKFCFQAYTIYIIYIPLTLHEHVYILFEKVHTRKSTEHTQC